MTNEKKMLINFVGEFSFGILSLSRLGENMAGIR